MFLEAIFGFSGVEKGYPNYFSTENKIFLFYKIRDLGLPTVLHNFGARISIFIEF